MWDDTMTDYTEAQVTQKLLYPGQTDGKFWVMKDGSKRPVANMEDKHLTNSINMLMRGIKSRQESVSLLLKEQDLRKQVKAEAAKGLRRMSSFATPTGRLIREDD